MYHPKIIRELKSLLNNQHGVALMIVMSAILVLTAVMIDFTFEGQINKFKGVNIEDRSQAKLSAEAGLKFAMTRLRLYKEAFNFLQNNEAASELASQQVINSIWNFPFIYPIPVTAQMNQVQKDIVNKFHDSTILAGNLRLIINNISNKINLNLIRVSLQEELNDNDQQDDGTTNDDPSLEDSNYDAEGQLIESLKLHIQRKSEENEEFAAQYFGMDVIPLVNNLKYYVSDPQSLENANNAQVEFMDLGITAKKAPMTSYHELYTLPGWTDELAEMVQGEFTVHGAIMIDLNEINDTMFRLLIPGVNDDEVSDFFKYRDDTEDPHFFNTLEDFKNYVVNQANLIGSEDFEERFKKFEAQGLRFGPSPSLFQVKSTAQVGRATYNLVAYVVLPAKPVPPPKPINNNNPTDPNQPNDPSDPSDPNDPNDPNDPSDPSDPSNNANNEEKKQKTLLLEPRIVEIFIN
jgi:hypothetical protein